MMLSMTQTHLHSPYSQSSAPLEDHKSSKHLLLPSTEAKGATTTVTNLTNPAMTGTASTTAVMGVGKSTRAPILRLKEGGVVGVIVLRARGLVDKESTAAKVGKYCHQPLPPIV